MNERRRVRSTLPTCPTQLEAPAAKERRRVARVPRDMGVLTLIDRAALAACCQAYMSNDFQNEVKFFGITSSPAFVRQPEGIGVAERLRHRSRTDGDSMSKPDAEGAVRHGREASSGPDRIRQPL